MIEVRFSKSEGMIALVQHRNGAVGETYLFPYDAAKKVVRKLAQSKSIIFGQGLESLDETEISTLTDKILRSHHIIRTYLEAQIKVIPIFSEAENKWVIKGSNPFGKEFLLSPILYDGFVTQLKQSKRIHFKDGSFADLCDAQLQNLLSEIEKLRQVISAMHKERVIHL
jgi:hypothetical protein